MTSCELYGCVADYVPENLCQCNGECELYNDCCIDYKVECTNTGDYAENNIIYASTVMAVILILMIVIIIQYILLKRNQNEKETKQKSITTTNDDRIVIFCTFISITFYFVCCVCYLIASISLKQSNFDRKVSSETASTIFWSFGYGFMQFVLAGRLYFTFNNTSYAYPKSVYIILSVIYLIATAAMITFHVEFNSEAWDNPLLLTTTIIGFICHICFLLLVMGLYIRALFKIAFNHSANLLGDQSKLEDNDTMKLLMDHTTRMSVLTGIAGTSTIVAFTVWCIFFAEEDEAQGGQGVSFLFVNIAWWLLPFDALINAICLFLNLPFIFTYSIYAKLCCCCHGICGSICTLIASSMLKKEDKKITETDKSATNQVNDQKELVTINN